MNYFKIQFYFFKKAFEVNKEDIEYFLLDFMEDNYSVEVGDDSEKYVRIN